MGNNLAVIHMQKLLVDPSTQSFNPRFRSASSMPSTTMSLIFLRSLKAAKR